MDGKNTLRAKVEELEKSEILKALRQNDWVKSKAAKALGITERMVAYRIRKYRLEKEVDRQRGHTMADMYRNTTTENHDKSISKEDANK